MARVVGMAFAGNSLKTSRLWLEAMARCSGRFEAVCERQAERADETAQRYRARWSFTDLDELLAESQPDIVLIAGVEAGHRLAMTRQVVRKGANAIVVGPPTHEPGAWNRLARAADQANRFVAVAMPYRFAPALVQAQRSLASGALGEPTGLIVRLHCWNGADSANDAADSSPDAAQLPFDAAFEAADRVCHLLGPANWVAATATPTHGLAASLRMRCGAGVSVWVDQAPGMWAAGSDVRLVGGPGARLDVVDDCEMRCWGAEGVSSEYRTRLVGGADAVEELGYRALLDEAAAAVRGRRQPEGSLGSLTDTLAVARAMVACVASGRAVRLDKVGRG